MVLQSVPAIIVATLRRTTAVFFQAVTAKMLELAASGDDDDWAHELRRRCGASTSTSACSP